MKKPTRRSVLILCALLVNLAHASPATPFIFRHSQPVSAAAALMLAGANFTPASVVFAGNMIGVPGNRAKSVTARAWRATTPAATANPSPANQQPTRLA